MHYAIIGAGMAGLACAESLSTAGHAVALFDKGRGPGGRMSTRRLATPLGEASFDHGAQYFTARDLGFRQTVAAWHALGVAEPWARLSEDAWVGTPGMNAVVKHMACAHDVSWDHLVAGIVRRGRQWWLAGAGGETGPFDGVVLAIPAEQAAPMLSLHDFALARTALNARSLPCWTGMYVFDRVVHELPVVIRTGGAIAWATCNSAKPGRSGPEAWVVQGDASWTEPRLELTPEAIAPALLATLATMMGCTLPEPVAAQAHRWRYALAPGTGDGALWRPELGLGVCGDWLLGPRVECAWLSGRTLAAAIAAG